MSPKQNMEFNFDFLRILRSMNFLYKVIPSDNPNLRIAVLNNNTLKTLLGSFNSRSSFRSENIDCKIRQLIDSMAKGSAIAQQLGAPLSTVSCLQSMPCRFYMLFDTENRICGIAKFGRKNLYMADSNGQLSELAPNCLLDFYVHENCQRSGFGRILFEFALTFESDLIHSQPSIPSKFGSIPYSSNASRSISVRQFESCNTTEERRKQLLPWHIAYDRPSPKLLSFLAKYYKLVDFTPQSNKFVLFNNFYSQPPIDIDSQAIIRMPPPPSTRAPSRRHSTGPSSLTKSWLAPPCFKPVVFDKVLEEDRPYSVSAVATEGGMALAENRSQMNVSPPHQHDRRDEQHVVSNINNNIFENKNVINGVGILNRPLSSIARRASSSASSHSINILQHDPQKIQQSIQSRAGTTLRRIMSHQYSSSPADSDRASSASNAINHSVNITDANKQGIQSNSNSFNRIFGGDGASNLASNSISQHKKNIFNSIPEEAKYSTKTYMSSSQHPNFSYPDGTTGGEGRRASRSSSYKSTQIWW